MPDLKLYTVAQVRDWLERNVVAEGLTNEVIRPAFAWALIHNPFVKDDDPIVAAIYDNGDLAASTCAYPEVFEKPICTDENGEQRRIWWFPMLWVKPEFRGKAYGLVAIGSLAEIYGEENAWTAWAVPESIEIFEYLGCKTYYFSRYFMGEKYINKDSLRVKLALLKQGSIAWWMERRMPVFPHYEFTLRYMTNVDEDSYRFMKDHASNHFFFPSKAQLDWILHYPCTISSPLTNRVTVEGEYFSDVVCLVQNHFVQVWIDKQLVGVYRLAIGDRTLSCDNVYYTKQYAEMVFASVVEHINKLGIRSFETEDEALYRFVCKYVYIPKQWTEQLSLSLSPDVQVIDPIYR